MTLFIFVCFFSFPLSLSLCVCVCLSLSLGVPFKIWLGWGCRFESPRYAFKLNKKSLSLLISLSLSVQPSCEEVLFWLFLISLTLNLIHNNHGGRLTIWVYNRA